MKIKDKMASKYEETEEEIKASHLVHYDSNRDYKRHANITQTHLVEYNRNEQEFSQKSIVSEQTLQGAISG